MHIWKLPNNQNQEKHVYVSVGSSIDKGPSTEKFHVMKTIRVHFIGSLHANFPSMNAKCQHGSYLWWAWLHWRAYWTIIPCRLTIFGTQAISWQSRKPTGIHISIIGRISKVTLRLCKHLMLLWCQKEVILGWQIRLLYLYTEAWSYLVNPLLCRFQNKDFA